MDTTEALQVFGSSFQVTYYNGTEYVNTTAIYTNGTRTLQDDVGQYPAGAACLQYTAPVENLNHNPEYITLDIKPEYSIFNTSQLHTAIMVYCTSSAAVPPYQTPQWRWTVNGSESIFYGLLDANSNIDTVTVASDVCIYIPVDITQQSTFQANSLRVTLVAPVSVYNGNLYIYLAPPYLSSDAFGESGTGSSGSTTTTSSSGSGSPDMEETNSLLGSIINWLQGFGQMILGLFIPDSDFLETWCEAMKALLEDHLGGAYDAIEMMIDLIESLYHPSTVGVISCPTMNLPGGLVLGGWTLNLKYNNAGMNTLYTALAWIIDFLATCFFLNSCRKKVEIILNPNSEVVSNDN